MQVPKFIPDKYTQLWAETFNAVYEKMKKDHPDESNKDLFEGNQVRAYNLANGRVKAELIRQFDWDAFINTPMSIEYYSSWELRESGVIKSKEETKINFNFKKSTVDVGLGVIYGIASKADIEDTEGDTIELIDLKRAAHDFMSESRNGDIDHDFKNHGDVVESLVIDKAIVEAIKAGEVTEGDWFIGYKPNDTEVAMKAASGEDFKGFSIGGICRRVIEGGDGNGEKT